MYERDQARDEIVYFSIAFVLAHAVPIFLLCTSTGEDEEAPLRWNANWSIRFDVFFGGGDGCRVRGRGMTSWHLDQAGLRAWIWVGRGEPAVGMNELLCGAKLTADEASGIAALLTAAGL